jgi:hypothetical protein
VKTHLLLEADNGTLSVMIDGQLLPLYWGDNGECYEARMLTIDEAITGKSEVGLHFRETYALPADPTALREIKEDLALNGLSQKEINEMGVRHERICVIS